MAEANPLFFATSGMRGKANTEMSPDLALRIGRAIVNWIKSNAPIKGKHRVCIGFDNRRNSKLLAYTAATAITSLGVNVIIAQNPIPTPFLIFSTMANQTDAGLMITGSHLPETDNGFILFDSLGNYHKGILEENEIELVPWVDLGKLQYLKTEEIDYLSLFSRFIDQVKLTPSSLKILIDPAHGVMKKYLYLVLEPIVSEIIKINWEDDDTFPGRISEPHPKNLTKTRNLFLEQRCDLGIATDMDGDRVIFISKSGKIISGDYIGALFASYIWKNNPDDVVIVPINTSAVISHVSKIYGGRLEFCEVGPPSIINAIREYNAAFAFEETGKYIFVKTAIWPDSVLTVIKLLSIMQNTGKDLDQLIAEFPIFYSSKTKLPFSRLNKKIFQREMNELIELEFSEIKNINDMDGFRIDFEDNSWMLIRLSGTEDYVRIFSEHTDQLKNEILNKKGHKIIYQLSENNNLL
ncbi:MAG: Phosphoglucosamine mutase [Candidatus Heimdallarchaeota archaeon LC_2]|nr:MAG: Phosphoglucosamine mutase [Candidatus Heimdallarchaeota archaeon LC_2]